MGLIVLFGIGIVLLASGLYSLWKYSPTKWRQIPAIVISSEAREHPARFSRTYTPRVRYGYEVSGITYTGNTYAFSSIEDGDSLESITELLHRYFESGTTITVWYMESEPSASCIKFNSPYSRSQMIALVVAGILILAVGAAVILMVRT